MEEAQQIAKDAVAPRRGAWIETYCPECYEKNNESRTPQGCVD